MKLKTAILATLVGLGTLPLLVSLALNVPQALARFEQTARQWSMSRLESKSFALQVRIERLKESVFTIASLPGMSALVGRSPGEGGGSAAARQGLVLFMEKWFRDKSGLIQVQVCDSAGRVLVRLDHGAGRGSRVGSSAHAQERNAELLRKMAPLPPGEVFVGFLDVGHAQGSVAAPHRYSLDMAAPLLSESGDVAGGVIFTIDLSDIVKEFQGAYWIGETGRFMHMHAATGKHEHPEDAEVPPPLSCDDLPRLQQQLKQGRPGVPVSWKCRQGHEFAWLPVIFNKGRPPTMWIGAPVDGSEAQHWLERYLAKLLGITLVLIVLVFFVAARIAGKVEAKKTEMLAGLNRILAGEPEVRFQWGGVVESRQLAHDLSSLAKEHFELYKARQSSGQQLKKHRDHLEELVLQRTSELETLNLRLNAEIAERAKTEEELRRHQEQLDERIDARTKELSDANAHLQEEIEERERVQQVLIDNEKRLRTILDSVYIGIFIVDAMTRNIVYANPAAAKMVGAAESGDLIGKKCHDCFGGGGEEECLVVEPGRPVENSEFELTRLDGKSRTVLKTVVPFTFMLDERRLLLESMTDITDFKRVTGENQRLQEQLYHSQKLEAVGLLAGGVAHDFNNLLTVIQGFTGLAMRSLKQSDPLWQHLLQIKEGSERAAALVRQLLLFSRRQPMKPVPLSLNSTVQNLLKMLGRLIGGNIEIKTDFAPDSWIVEADSGNMDQVIMNFAVNARDAMPGGGILTIRTANIEISGEAVRNDSEKRPGRYACLTVADTGEGMTPEVMGHIFEPFFTTKEEGKGTGLGLAVIYGIVKQHGGWVEVESEAGQGTAFTVCLPAMAALPEEAVQQEDVEEFNGNGERILLVEDEEGVAAFVVDALKQHGYEVVYAADARKALELFQKEQGRFDLLFSDVVLPGESGIQLVDAILSQKPDLPVMLSSGYADQRSQWSVILERGFPYLQKPYDMQGLLRMIRKLIAKP